LCYSELKVFVLSFGSIMNLCETCDLELTSSELLELKAATYDSIIKHLLDSSDERRREQIRTKIALKNIKKWAKENLSAAHVAELEEFYG
jgi:hypothetical protein